jgi:long-chain acyl-CoA synthetase
VDSAENLLAQQTVIRAIRNRMGGKLKFAVSGGAPLSADLGRELGVMGFTILEGYGLTETSGPVAINLPNDPSHGTVGPPLVEVELQFSSDGEILVRSPKNFMGYWNRPEATAEVLRDGWLHTGDLGFLDSEGRLHITDRRKELIKLSSGKSVAPQKIESLARASRILEDFVVLGDGRSYLAALVTLNREVILKFCAEKQILFSSFKELVEHAKVQSLVQTELEQINSGLAEYEKIRRFVILPEALTVYAGVMTPTQKLRRRQILERYQPEIEALYPGLDPENPLG